MYIESNIHYAIKSEVYKSVMLSAVLCVWLRCHGGSHTCGLSEDCSEVCSITCVCLYAVLHSAVQVV